MLIGLAGDEGGCFRGEQVVLGDEGVSGRDGLPQGLRLSKLDALELRDFSKEACFLYGWVQKKQNAQVNPLRLALRF